VARGEKRNLTPVITQENNCIARWTFQIPPPKDTIHRVEFHSLDLLSLLGQAKSETEKGDEESRDKITRCWYQHERRFCFSQCSAEFSAKFRREMMNSEHGITNVEGGF
jgi:hypothetical protein